LLAVASVAPQPLASAGSNLYRLDAPRIFCADRHHRRSGTSLLCLYYTFGRHTMSSACIVIAVDNVHCGHGSAHAPPPLARAKRPDSGRARDGGRNLARSAQPAGELPGTAAAGYATTTSRGAPVEARRS